MLALLPLFGMNAIGYLRSRRILEEQVQRYLHEIADLQAGHVAEHLRQQLSYLTAVGAGNRFLQAAAEREAGGLMADVATDQALAAYLARQVEESEGQFSSLALFALNGRLLGAPEGHVRPYWRAGASTEPITVVRHDSPMVPPTLRYTIPVTSTEGEVVAYLAGSVSAMASRALVGFEEHLAGSIESFILDPAGRPVFVSHPHGQVRYDEPMPSPLLELPPGSRGRYRNAEGEEVIATTVPVPGSPWIFLAELPSETAFGELRSLQRLSLLLGSGFSVLVILAAWLLARGIVRPVQAVVAGTRRVAGGELEARVPEEGPTELRALAAAFNEMAAELADNARRLEEMHRQEIARAEQLATVGELAAGVAHEIKNPLAGIAGGMDLLLRRVGDDERLTAVTREMRRQVDRMEAAVRDLLAFARPPSPSLAPTDVNEVAKRVADLAHATAERSEVALELHLDPSLPSLVADGQQLGQAVLNLVVNAVQHCEDGGRVRLSTRATPEAVCIEVADDGSGIPDEVMPHLFRPFFTTRHHGTGLGLSITLGIVERHGGRLDVRSMPGEGATFTIILPRTTEAPQG